MNWFDEQIKQRKLNDEEMFAESFFKMARPILGKNISAALYNDELMSVDAMKQVLNYYHIKYRETPDRITDFNEQLEFQLRPHGIARRFVNLNKGWYKDCVGAMLGSFKEDGRVVALIPTGFSGYSYYDPATDKFIKINRNNQELFDLEAIAFYRPFPLRKINISDLAKYILGNINASDITLVIVSFLIIALLGLILPALNNVLFSTVIKHKDISLLITVAITMIALTLSTVLFDSIKTLIMTRIETKIEVSVEAASMMRITSLSPDFFKKFSSGELSSYMQNIQTLCSILINTCLSSGLTSVFSIVYIFQIMNYAPALVVPALIIILTTAAVSLLITILQTKISKAIMQNEAKEAGMIYAMISGIQKIRLSGAEKRAFARWGDLYSKSAELQYNLPLLLKIQGTVTSAIALIGTIFIYREAIVNQISVADYYSFSVAYGMVDAAFLGLAGVATSIATIKPVLDMAKPILDAEPEISEGKQILSRISGNIEINNVSFRYNDNMPYVLDNISLKIKAGQYVAIVGKTGCGKSTLIRLLLGFEKPGKGAIYYDGKDINSVDLKSLRRKIGTVIQDGKLFQGDIYSNIVVSAPWLTVEDAWQAAEMAGMADDIENMPMGMNTLISEGAGGISGGQKQRLMIARAIAPKPKILIFDEATSALDNITQKKVSESLDELKCTRIVVAHRLSTIQHCDRIIVLDKGQIIEDGSYDELISQNGFFAELVSRQRLDKGE